MQKNNRNSKFYISFVRVLNDFFLQEPAKEFTLFWSSVSKDDLYELQVIFSWEFEMGGVLYKGGSCDIIWKEQFFNASFWNTRSNLELNSKIEGILKEHTVEKPNDNKESFFGVVFSKENWKETLITAIGCEAIDFTACEDKRFFLNDYLKSDSDNYLDENTSFSDKI